MIKVQDLEIEKDIPINSRTPYTVLAMKMLPGDSIFFPHTRTSKYQAKYLLQAIAKVHGVPEHGKVKISDFATRRQVEDGDRVWRIK